MKNCKRCDSTLLYEDTREVETLVEGEFKKVDGVACKECDCFHFDLDGIFIFQFSKRDDYKSNTNYTTDYARQIGSI